MVFSFPKRVESLKCPMHGTCLKSRRALCIKYKSKRKDQALRGIFSS